MINRLAGTVFASLLSIACAQPHAAPEDNAQLIGQMQKADKSFVLSDPDSKQRCKADADCPLGDFCHPDQSVCFQSYPNPRMLDMSTLGKDCIIVNVYFSFDSSELVPDVQRWLDYNLRCINSRSIKKLRLEGFGDTRGSQGYNVKLSERRAEAVKQHLQQRGALQQIEVLGEGERRPLRVGTSEKDYAYNRRVEFKVE